MTKRRAELIALIGRCSKDGNVGLVRSKRSRRQSDLFWSTWRLRSATVSGHSGTRLSLLQKVGGVHALTTSHGTGPMQRNL